MCFRATAALAAQLKYSATGVSQKGSLGLHSFACVFVASLLARLLVRRQEKLDAYSAADDLQPTEKDQCLKVFEKMCGVHRPMNLFSSSTFVEPNTTAVDEENRAFTDDELRVELLKWERMMQEGTVPDGAVTDQWRVYSEATVVLRSNDKPLRLVLQASAGTCKSFLLETIFCGVTLTAARCGQQHQLASLQLVCACHARLCTPVLCIGSVLSASTGRASWTPRTRKTTPPNGWRA